MVIIMENIKVFHGNTSVDDFLNKIFFESEAIFYSKKISNVLSMIYKRVLELNEIYCTLVKLDKADAIDLSNYLSDEQIQHIESLLKLYNLQCRVDF